MRLAQAIKTSFLRSFRFSGRASRSEWRVFLLPGLAMPVTAFALLHGTVPDITLPQSLGLAALTLLPIAAVSARRLADSDTNPADIHPPTGLLAGASLFGHMALPSSPGPNRYGPNSSEVQS
ncbi:DUF805 domain-containing protein [Gemmobacter sp. 24YEA27]|uniref:DUF805 domain-containing protein n=1 Tax=Gemmobacter sp. 24YEA27 TaxID=3040672 RepID=UPI0024B35CA7|nr:DUF805 domain-containing protein [Gemmobacter sp. 24YEA27]